MADIAAIPVRHRRAISILLSGGLVGWSARALSTYRLFIAMRDVGAVVRASIAGGRGPTVPPIESVLPELERVMEPEVKRAGKGVMRHFREQHDDAAG